MKFRFTNILIIFCLRFVHKVCGIVALDSRLTVFLSVARFPVILRRFHLNPGTGGNGFHRGGDGVVRELLFRRSQVLSVLGERRAFRPYGLKGTSLGEFSSCNISASFLFKYADSMNSLNTRDGK